MRTEEIDIIELLKRVKEGNAPKRIEVGEIKAEYNEDGDTIETLYITENGMWLEELFMDFDTKIKILDKPIIEELEIIDDGIRYISPDTFEITTKVNEIIKWINNKENRYVKNKR